MGRRSDRTADVIPHGWRCHCGPEHTLSESVHWLRPVEGRFTSVPATKSQLLALSYKTETPVHPHYCEEGAEKKRAYSTPHPCAELRGVLFSVAIVHTLLREPLSDESRQTAEVHELARRPSTNRRTAKWGSPSHSTEHRGKVRREQPGPDDRPRSLAASVVPFYSLPAAPQKCNCQLGPLQPRPNLSRLHKCNSQLRTCIRTPERTRKSKCSLFQSCRGVIRPISATERPDLHFCNPLRFSVHPSGIANEGIRPRSYRGAHMSAPISSYAQRLDRSHWTAGPGP